MHTRAFPRLLMTLVVAGALALPFIGRADVLDFLGLRKKSGEALQLAEDQIISGLREALARGVENAVTNLSRVNGFLNDPQARIPVPESLQWVDRTFRAAGQDAIADEFVTTLNRAAEAAIPQAGAVLGDAVRQITIADARSILDSKNETALTEYFERVSRTNLHTRILPIVKTTTDQVGVTSTYKRLVDQAPVDRLGFFGRLRTAVPKVRDLQLDLDDYVTTKTLDGLFLKMADEEKRIRKDPSARVTEVLENVFGRRSASAR
jgi:hypothetical protein